jgi:hypothetical protein
MCGDLEDDSEGFEDQLYARFRLHARQLLRGHGGQGSAPAKDLNAYMDKLFGDALSRSLRDGEDAESGYDLLRLQPLVFARLAGFLAAHASLKEDPLRKVMEALMHGYAEAEHIEVDHHGHDHDHEHGHEHGHGHHHHGHDHHH